MFFFFNSLTTIKKEVNRKQQPKLKLFYCDESSSCIYSFLLEIKLKNTHKKIMQLKK